MRKGRITNVCVLLDFSSTVSLIHCCSGAVYDPLEQRWMSYRQKEKRQHFS